MSGNAQHPNEPSEHRDKVSLTREFSADIGFELLPDGATMIFLLDVGAKRYEFTLPREKVVEIGAFLLEQAKEF